MRAAALGAHVTSPYRGFRLAQGGSSARRTRRGRWRWPRRARLQAAVVAGGREQRELHGERRVVSVVGHTLAKMYHSAHSQASSLHEPQLSRKRSTPRLPREVRRDFIPTSCVAALSLAHSLMIAVIPAADKAQTPI